MCIAIHIIAVKENSIYEYIVNSNQILLQNPCNCTMHHIFPNVKFGLSP